MTVHDAMQVRPGGMNRAVNDKSGDVHVLLAVSRAAVDHVAVEIDCHEVGSGYFVITQSEAIDQKTLRVRYLGSDVVPYDVRKAVHIRDAVTGCKIQDSEVSVERPW